MSKKKTPAKPKAKSKPKAKEDLKNYTYDEDTDTFFDKNGEKVAHQGTINILKGRSKGWPKGFCPNKNGRPKGSKNRASTLRDLIDLTVMDASGNPMPNPLDKSEKKISYEKAIMVALIKKALKGDVRAIQEIQDTIYGKLDEQQVIKNPDGSAAFTPTSEMTDAQLEKLTAVIAGFSKDKSK